MIHLCMYTLHGLNSIHETSVEQYTGYVDIPQYYFPVLSNFLILQYRKVNVQYSSLKKFFQQMI